MKIKMKDPSVSLPNAWKQCGLSKKDWDELQNGKTVEATSCPDYLEYILEAVNTKTIKKESE